MSDVVTDEEGSSGHGYPVAGQQRNDHDSSAAEEAWLAEEKALFSEAKEGGKIQVIWVTNAGNTGHKTCVPTLINQAYLHPKEQRCIRPALAKPEILHAWLKNAGFVRHPMTLCDAMGLQLRCYAQRYVAQDEHRGCNNVFATYMTAVFDTGLAPRTILGKALFTRVHPTTGAEVSLSMLEFVRAAQFIQDLMDVYPDDQLYAGGVLRDPAGFRQVVRGAYEFYSLHKPHNMGATGLWTPDGQSFWTLQGRSPDLVRAPSLDVM